jgi:hypothetical protein
LERGISMKMFLFVAFYLDYADLGSSVASRVPMGVGLELPTTPFSRY